MPISVEVICKCKKTKFWVSDGEETLYSCPSCGRRYRGEYNSETLTIDAIEIEGE